MEILLCSTYVNLNSFKDLRNTNMQYIFKNNKLIIIEYKILFANKNYIGLAFHIKNMFS